MSTKNISIAAVVLLSLGLAYWVLGRGGEPSKDTPAPAAKQTPTVPKKLAPKEAAKADGQGTPKRSLEVSYDDDPAGSLRLEGQVITAEDDPVAGATVVIDSRPPRTVTTDEDGSFFFEKLVARNYQLAARSEEGAAGPVTARLSETNDPVILVVREGGVVNVKTVRKDGKPAVGAEVELRGIDVQSQTSDSSGAAQFRNVSLGRYEVVAKAPGLVPSRTMAVLSRAGASAEVSLVLKEGARVAGIVVDADGKPVADAKVYYSGAADWSIRADRLDSVASAQDGSFAFEALPKGSFRFVADAKGLAQGSSEVIELDGESEKTGVEVRMQPSATLRGMVVDAEGAPIPAARVRVSESKAGVVGGGVRQAYTDETGRYEIADLRRRGYSALALHETASSEILAVDLSAPPYEAELDIPLSVTGAIAGTVVDSAGEPVAGAQISLMPDFLKGETRSSEEWRMRGVDTELTDAGGAFRITGLAKGKNYRVRATPSSSNNPGRAWLVEGTPATTGDEDVHIVLPADGGIRGKVTLASGDAPSTFTVSVGWMRGTPFSSKDGSFELADLPPQNFTVTIEGPDFDRKAVKVLVEEGKIADLGSITVVQGRKVTGTIVDASGRPVAGAVVSAGREVFGDGSSAQAAGGARSPGARATKSATTDEEGNFVIPGVIAGDISVVADHPEVGRSKPISVTMSSESLIGIQLELLPTGALQGVVRTSGEPAGGVVVTAASTEFPGVTFNVATGADGTYRFDRLIADTYRVRAMYRANPMAGMAFFAEQTRVTVDATQTLDIDFGGGDASIRVTLEADKQLGFTWISLVGADVNPQTARELRNLQARATGYEAATMSIAGSSPTLSGVPAGAFKVCALVYPNEVTGMEETMSYGEREGDNLPAQCSEVEVPEGVTEVATTLSVVVPEFVPAPPTGSGEDQD